MKEIEQKKELLFEGLKIYFSASIKGAKEPDPNFAWELVNYMKENGADVLSEHVAARNQNEMDEVRAAKIGMTTEEMTEILDSKFVRKQDLKWVDQATHVVALINAPSHGVGMELQEAILKPRLGMNETPILCLIREDLLSSVSRMIEGVDNEKVPNFSLQVYRDLGQAKTIIKFFLITTSVNRVSPSKGNKNANYE
jgi:hypothetical protein